MDDEISTNCGMQELVLSQELCKHVDDLYRNKIILGPMVRINSLPLRLLCIDYGIHTVFSEEIIDKKLVKCARLENLNDDGSIRSVDYVIDRTVLFSTIPSIEKNRLVLQLGKFFC